MGNLPSEITEEVINMIEELYCMRIRKGAEIWRFLNKNGYKLNPATVYKYIGIVRRRLRNKYKQIKLNKALTDELNDLDYMQKKLWIDYQKAISENGRAAFMNSILKCKERISKLLGLDTININQGQSKTLEDLLDEDDENNNNEDEENKQTIDRGSVMDTKQETGKGKIQIESNPAKV